MTGLSSAEEGCTNIPGKRDFRETLSGVEVIRAGFIDHADISVTGSGGVFDHSVQLPDLQ